VNDLRFAVVSDVHLTFRPDAQGCGPSVRPPEERLETVLEAAVDWEADVVVNLGDLHPQSFEEGPGRRALAAWRSVPAETVSVLGNHDADSISRERYMDALGMPAPYYSRTIDGWTFVVLDSGDPAFAPGTEDEHPAETQLKWFREELERAPNRCVVLVHNGTNSVFYGGEVPPATKRIIDDANRAAGYRKVVAYLWGHDHRTGAFRSAGVDYVLVNSATYRWDADVGPIFYRDPPPYGLGVVDASDGSLALEGTGVPDNWAIDDCAGIPAAARPDDDMTFQQSVGTD
jgi:hypothetical protein